MLTNATQPGDYDLVRQDIKLILPNIDWDDSCFLGPVFLRLVSNTPHHIMPRALLVKKLNFTTADSSFCFMRDRAGMRLERMTRMTRQVEQMELLCVLNPKALTLKMLGLNTRGTEILKFSVSFTIKSINNL
jgi:hypothetical protein